MHIHKRLFKYGKSAILITALLVMTHSAVAVDPIDNPIQSRSFAAVLEKIAEWVQLVGLPVLMFFLALSGIFFVTAQGNEEKLKQARTMLVWTLVGALIIAGASAIASAIINFAERLGAGL